MSKLTLERARSLMEAAVAHSTLSGLNVASMTEKQLMSFAKVLCDQAKRVNATPEELIENSEGLFMENPGKAFQEAFGGDPHINRIPEMAYLADRVDENIIHLTRLQDAVLKAHENAADFTRQLTERQSPWSQQQYNSYELNMENLAGVGHQLIQLATMVDVGLTYKRTLNLYLMAPDEKSAEMIIEALVSRGTPEELDAMRALRKTPHLYAVPSQTH